MLEIKVRVEGFERTRAYLAGRAKQVAFATAKALTDTAGQIREAIPSALEQQLDRPTEFTKRGVFVRPARRDNLAAVVGFMDRQAEYLKYQIAGGDRAPNKQRLRLPSNIVLDQFGNLPKDTIARLIAAADSGKFGAGVKRRLGVAGRRKGQRNAAQLSLFYGQPKNHPTWPVGIYRRVPGSPGKLVPVIVFPAQRAHYKPRFKFAELGARIVRQNWQRNFAAAFDLAMRTAR